MRLLINHRQRVTFLIQLSSHIHGLKENKKIAKGRKLPYSQSFLSNPTSQIFPLTVSSSHSYMSVLWLHPTKFKLFPPFFLFYLLLLCISKLHAEYNKVMNVANKEISSEKPQVKHLNLNSGGLQGLLLSITFRNNSLMLEITVECCSEPTDLLCSSKYREKSLIFKSNWGTNRFFI